MDMGSNDANEADVTIAGAGSSLAAANSLGVVCQQVRPPVYEPGQAHPPFLWHHPKDIYLSLPLRVRGREDAGCRGGSRGGQGQRRQKEEKSEAHLTFYIGVRDRRLNRGAKSQSYNV
jgi:hypothetical protein